MSSRSLRKRKRPLAAVPAPAAAAPEIVSPNSSNLLGSEDAGMLKIPPNRNDAQAIQCLEVLAAAIEREQKMLEDLADHQPTNSIRRIQGSRLEMFLWAKGKKTTALDRIIKMEVKAGRLPRNVNVKEVIVEYAKKQALRDGRLHRGRYRNKGAKFNTFSLIINFGRVDAQAPHTDLKKPNFQFGLALSDHIPGTLVYEADPIPSVDKLVESTSCPWTDAPEPLCTAWKQNDEALKLLADYGAVLRSRKALDLVEKSFRVLPTGAVLSLPGSVLHAGPAVAGFRVVLFFSANPRHGEDAEYDPDDQYPAVFLVGHLLQLLWGNVEPAQRLYLLHQLQRYMNDDPVVGREWHGFFQLESPLSKLMRDMEVAKNNGSSVDEAQLEAASRDNAFCS